MLIPGLGRNAQLGYSVMGNTLARHANVRVDKHNVKCIRYTFALVFLALEM